MRVLSLLRFLGLLMLALSCFHCTTTTPTETRKETTTSDAATKDTQATVCSTDPDCKDPLRPFCHNNHCILFCRPDGCLEDRDCGQGKRCDGGICMSKMPCGCASDNDCSVPESCVQCICVKTPECRSSKDCKKSDKPRCFQGFCIKASCKNDGDCNKDPDRYSCEDFRCSQKRCKLDKDCTNSRYPSCRDGLCRPAFCKSDDDCKDPAPICRYGRCLRVDCVKGG